MRYFRVLQLVEVSRGLNVGECQTFPVHVLITTKEAPSPAPLPPFYQGPGPWDVIIRIAFLGVALIKGSMRATLRVLCRCLNIWNRVLGYCTVLILNYTKER